MQKSWNDFYFLEESEFQESFNKQNFYACARAKKRDVARTFPLIKASF